MYRWLAVFLLLLAVPPLGGSQAKMFNPQAFTLKNGLQVVVLYHPGAPIVSLNLFYKVGAADDPADMVGLSHFLEHLMFLGSKNVSREDFTKQISQHGGYCNAHTSYDYTCYEICLPAPYLELALKMEADRMHTLVIDKKSMESEREVVKEERRMRIENNPFGQISESIYHLLFWVHPYGVPIIGFPHQIAAYTKEALEKCYRTWYVPNNAVLLLAGDLPEITQVKALVKKYFASIASKPLPQKQRAVEPSHAGTTINLKAHSSRISLTNVEWFFTAPNQGSKHKNFFYPLTILSHILAGNEVSRLYIGLVEDKKLAVEVSISYLAPALRDPWPLGISATLAPNASLVELKQALAQELNKLMKDGVSERELADAKRDLLTAVVMAQDSASSMIPYFIPLVTGMTLEEIENYPENISQVTRHQVHEAAKFVFSRPPVLKATVFPSPQG